MIPLLKIINSSEFLFCHGQYFVTAANWYKLWSDSEDAEECNKGLVLGESADGSSNLEPGLCLYAWIFDFQVNSLHDGVSSLAQKELMS